MKRLSLLAAGVMLQIYAFAQRGKVRPEWDLDGGSNVSHHSIDDDFYSFLFFIGLIVLFFIFTYFSGLNQRHKEKVRLKEQQAQEAKKVYIIKEDTKSYDQARIFDNVSMKKGERCRIVQLWNEQSVVIEMLDRENDKRHLIIDRDKIELE